MVLVDTSVWIEASRRKGDLAYKVGLENLLEEYEAAWCSPVKLEFMGGARQEDRKKLAFWFDCIPYRLAEEKHWEQAKTNAWKLRDCGHSLPWHDILIASMAIEMDLRVYAKDKHFELMKQVLGLRLYTPGYGGRYEPES
ncbi:MAG: putative nucleic acid-binding protein [Lentimonas sp.]|jgi:predicted nucleic acid-binding protein